MGRADRVDAVLVKPRFMKQAIIAMVLIGAGALLAHLHVASQTYHPVVRLTSSDGLVYTTVQDEVGERRACGAAPNPPGRRRIASSTRTNGSAKAFR